MRAGLCWILVAVVLAWLGGHAEGWRGAWVLLPVGKLLQLGIEALYEAGRADGPRPPHERRRPDDGDPNDYTL